MADKVVNVPVVIVRNDEQYTLLFVNSNMRGWWVESFTREEGHNEAPYMWDVAGDKAAFDDPKAVALLALWNSQPPKNVQGYMADSLSPDSENCRYIGR